VLLEEIASRRRKRRRGYATEQLDPTIARDETNWAAHLYVYPALISLGLTLLYQALRGPEEPRATR
jgi:hypothetical protein